MPRAIDHAVLPTADLAVARARLAALGFAVAPEGRHPFGTANACVYLADGTFLESLAIADEAAAHAASQAGNVFVGHDAIYRTRVGQEGFSALVFSSDDADADHARFVDLGISAGARLDFSRPFTGADGASDTASFRLAFAGDLRAPDALFFTCERVNQPAVDRAALTRHPNGVAAMARVIVSAPEPEHFQLILERIADGQASAADAHGIDIPAGGCVVSVRSPEGMREWMASDPAEAVDRSAHLAAVLFTVADLDATAALLDRNGIAADRVAGRLVVAPAPGQGATFIFGA